MARWQISFDTDQSTSVEADEVRDAPDGEMILFKQGDDLVCSVNRRHVIYIKKLSEPAPSQTTINITNHPQTVALASASEIARRQQRDAS